MAGQGLARREILRILGIATIASHCPGFVTWAFAAGHPRPGSDPSPNSRFEPQFCSGAEYALVARLTELIIPSDETPGAKEAGVAEFVDFMLAHDPEQRQSFRAGLVWLNSHAERSFGRPFLELAEPQQVELLEPLAYAGKYRVGEEVGQGFFRSIRELTVTGFYTSRIGYLELDNPALRYYTESPACPHAADPEHRHLPPPKR
jgi:gluconate 2-dehydrogenase subunit 3-like protein